MHAVSTALYPIHEVFASIQGEGLYVGEPQVFVRLSACPLRCLWCDSPETWKLPARAPAADELPKELGRTWSTAQEVASYLESLDPSGRQTISVTGGEPLMWPDFLIELRELLPERRLHLETAGAFPKSLARVLDVVDHVSSDLKLPADLAAPVELDGPFEPAPKNSVDWSACRKQILPMLNGRDACAKLVVAGERRLEDYEDLLRDHALLAPDLPLYLQPVSPTRSVPGPQPVFLTQLAELAATLGLLVRVVPQLHVHLGLR